MSETTDFRVDSGIEAERGYAIEILEALEDLLESKDVTVPCDEDEEAERSEDEYAARLYGTPYYDLEDIVTEVLEASCAETGEANIVNGLFDEIKDHLNRNDAPLLIVDADAADTLKAAITGTVKKFLAADA